MQYEQWWKERIITNKLFPDDMVKAIRNLTKDAWEESRRSNTKESGNNITCINGPVKSQEPGKPCEDKCEKAPALMDGIHVYEIEGKCIHCGKERPLSQEPSKPDEAVVVPQADIDRLEVARVVLCALLGDDIKFLEALDHVTPAMHQITHRKYEKIKLDSTVDRLVGLKNERDELVRRLWCVLKNMSDLIKPDDFADEDLDLWQQVTQHSAVQSRLDNKQAKAESPHMAGRDKNGIQGS